MRGSAIPHIPGNVPRSAGLSEANKNILVAAKGGSVSFAGKLFTYVSSAIFSVMVARLLGAEQFGLYKLALTITTIATVVNLLGLDGGVVRYLPIALIERNEAKIRGVIQIGTGIPVLISLVMTVILFLIAKPLAYEVLDKPAILPILRVAMFAIPLAVMNECLSSIAQGFKRMQPIAYAQDITFNLMKLILASVILALGFGVTALTAVYVVSMATGMVLLLYCIHRLLPLSRAFDTAQRNTREMLHYSLPLYLQRLLNRVGKDFETLVLGYFALSADVGVYAVILQLGMVGDMAFGSLRAISAPIISELYSQGKREELQRFYQTTTRWALTFNLPIFLTIVLFTGPLLSIFGKEFTVGATGLIILSAGELFNITTGTCGTVINMTGYSRVGLLNSVVYLTTTLLLDFTLIPKWHLVGAALAGALTIVITNTLRLAEVYVLINGLLPFNRSSLKPIVAALLAAGLAYSLRDLVFPDRPLWQLLVLGPAMWLVYVAAVLAQKLSEEDRMIINKVWGRMRLKLRYQ